MAAKSALKNSIGSWFKNPTDGYLNELLGPGGAEALRKLDVEIERARSTLYPSGTAPQRNFSENVLMMIKQSTLQKRYENPVYAGPEIPYYNADVFKKGARLSRFANASYAVPATNVMCDLVPSLTPENIHLVYSSKGVGCPHFFIATDPETDQLVLSIRGTADATDALTDTLAEKAPFLGGNAHLGMFENATAVIEQGRDKLVELMTGTGKTLSVTGHSLGAGTAVLVMLMLCGETGYSAPFHAGRNTTCWAFAAPPVFGPPERIPRWTSSNIFAFVHHVDMIPRLGLAAVFSLCQAEKIVDEMDISASERASFLLNYDTSFRMQLPDHGSYGIMADVESAFTKFTSVGTNILMFNDKDGKITCYTVEPYQLNNRILLHQNMVTCHLLGGYIKIIDECVNDLEPPPGLVRRIIHSVVG